MLLIMLISTPTLRLFIVTTKLGEFSQVIK